MRNFVFLLILFLGMSLTIKAQGPPPPPPPSTNSTSTQEFGNSQNNIIGAQSRSFGGGSIIKPNPMLTSADFAFIQNPTYESGWRYGTAIGFSKINMGRGYGINAIVTLDLTQQTYSAYYRKQKWFYHLNLGRMGYARNLSMSVSKIWEPKSIKKFSFGSQIGIASVENKSKTSQYFVAVPYAVIFAEKNITVNKIIDWRPEAFITICSPYYDIGMNFFSTSKTFNAVVGNNVGIKFGKKFKLNVDWRMNMNTTPKWGVMNNILIGSNLKF